MSPVQTTPLRVFIAEDSRLFQHALLSCLDLVGNVEVVGQAFTGEDAVAGIETTRPDLVILDVMMPQGDGFSVLRSLRAREHSPVVIVLTFFAQQSIRNTCRQLGAHFVYDKADAFHPLMALLKNLASAHKPHHLLQESCAEQLSAIQVLTSA